MSYKIQSILHHQCHTRTTRVQHEKHESNTSATRMQKFDSDSDTSENIFSHPYISYTTNERLKREEQFHSKIYLLEIPRSHAKMGLKSAPQKLNFVMTKAISKRYTLDCSRKYPSIKTALCETNNICLQQELLKTRENECQTLKKHLK